MTRTDKYNMLSTLVTRDEFGRHFSEVWDPDVLQTLEALGLIEISRPVHPCGVPYGEEFWTVSVTDAGVEVVDGGL